MSTSLKISHQTSMSNHSVFRNNPGLELIDATCDQTYEYKTRKNQERLRRQQDTASNIESLAKLAPYGFVTSKNAMDFSLNAANYSMSCSDFSVVSLAKCLLDQSGRNSKTPSELLECFAKSINCNVLFHYNVKSVMSKGLLDLVKASSSVDDLLHYTPEGIADFLFLCFVFPSQTFVNLGECLWYFLLGLLCPHAASNTELEHLSHCAVIAWVLFLEY